jgi:hypothetical protein
LFIGFSLCYAVVNKKGMPKLACLYNASKDGFLEENAGGKPVSRGRQSLKEETSQLSKNRINPRETGNLDQACFSR